MKEIQTNKTANIRSPRTKTFISYSRKEVDTAEYLKELLTSQEFDVFLDKHDILPGEEWRPRISKLIQTADNLIFLMSPNSIASSICDWEVNEAERLRKHIYPVVIQEVDPESTPGRLKRLNFIFMRTPVEMTEALQVLTSALTTDIEWIREHTRLSELASRWKDSGTPDDQLLRGRELDLSEAWATRWPKSAPNPSDVTLKFITNSRTFATKQTRRALQRSRTITIGSLIAAAIMTVLGWSFYSAWQSSMVNHSRHLAGLANDKLDRGDIYTARLLAIEALPDPQASLFSEERWRPYVETAWKGLATGWLMRLSLPGHSAPVKTAIYSPDGHQILTTSLDSTARLWDTNGRLLKVLDEHDGPIWHAAFSYDGRLIATASNDSTVRLWTRDGNSEMLLETAPHLPDGSLTQSGEPPSVSKVAFSPSGERIVAAGGAREAFLWDFDGRFLTLLSGHTSAIKDVVFSVDGKLILSASGDGTARLWRAENGELIEVFDDHDDIVWTAQFNPLGNSILTVSKDGTAKLWDINGTLLKTLNYDGENVWTGVFTPDGQRIVTASADKTARLWSDEGKLIRVLEEYDDDAPSAITFSQDGKQMIVSASFGDANIYKINGDYLGKAGTDGQWVDKGARFSPNGQRILGPSGNSAIELEYIPDPESFVEWVKDSIPVCLPQDRRRDMFLSPEPPQWCLELEKEPYGNAQPAEGWQKPLIARVLATN